MAQTSTTGVPGFIEALQLNAAQGVLIKILGEQVASVWWFGQKWAETGHFCPICFCRGWNQQAQELKWSKMGCKWTFLSTASRQACAAQVNYSEIPNEATSGYSNVHVRGSGIAIFSPIVPLQSLARGSLSTTYLGEAFGKLLKPE